MRAPFPPPALLLAVAAFAVPRSGAAQQGARVATAVARVDATRTLGRFGPLCYGLGLRGAAGKAQVRRFAESGGDVLRLLPPEGGWSQLSRDSIRDCFAAVETAGLTCIVSLADCRTAESCQRELGELGLENRPAETFFELHPEALKSDSGWLVQLGLSRADDVRLRLVSQPLPTTIWPQFVVADLDELGAERSSQLLTVRDDRAEEAVTTQALICYPLAPHASAVGLFEQFRGLTSVNPVGTVGTPSRDRLLEEVRRLEELISFLGQACRLRQVRVPVSAAEPLRALAGRYAGGVSAVAGNPAGGPVKASWSIRAPRGIYQPYRFVLGDRGRIVDGEELAPLIAKSDGAALRLASWVPGNHLCGLRLTNHPYAAYRVMGDIRAQIGALKKEPLLSQDDRDLLLLPLADARKSAANLLAPKPLTPRKVQFWSHQALIRFAQVEQAFRNLVESNRLSPLAAGALAGQIQQAMEHLSASSSAGFGLRFGHELKPALGDPGAPREVIVRVVNGGKSSVSRVRIEVDSEAPVEVVAKGATQVAKLRPGGTFTTSFSLRRRESVEGAACRATLSYSALRSYARRTRSFHVSWRAATGGPDSPRG